jgi:lysylphosphatidylglycerol synthetase-like protein (DUF2156 family)
MNDKESCEIQLREHKGKLADEAIHWLLVLFVGNVLLSSILALEYFLLGEGQWAVALQAWLTRLGAFILAVVCLLGAIVAFDRVTPHVYLEEITKDPRSCAAVIMSFVLAVAWIITCTQ